MAIAHAPDSPPTTARLRSGTAARLAGLPVTTLRVWERRYGVVAPPKTVTGQRLYSNHDVQRLKLLRQLSDQGHAIGTMATLALDALRTLAAGLPPDAMTGPTGIAAAGTSPAAGGPLRRVTVVGRSLARKLRVAAGITLHAVHDDLGQAESEGPSADEADVLLVHLPSLQPASAERVLAQGAARRAAAIVVVYAFGAEAVARSLRAAGAAVCREPVSGRELAQIIAATRGGESTATATAGAGPQIAARRFSDDALADLAERASSVACECPRHLAEIVMQLVGFERYSEECGSANPADAALHRHLRSMAGAARTLFEESLAQVLAQNRIEVR
jgi:MerR family transcriptional regulator, light-induced transcriptional regulator